MKQTPPISALFKIAILTIFLPVTTFCLQVSLKRINFVNWRQGYSKSRGKNSHLTRKSKNFKIIT